MLYVITAVHDRYKITEAFVKQLLRQTYKDICLILVDDGSKDGTAEMVKSMMPNSVILHGDGTLWWGGALHEAYRWVKDYADQSAYVMFANDDSAFDDNYIEQALTLLENKEKVLLTGCGVSKQSGKIVDGAVLYEPRTIKSEVIGAGVGNCASTRSLFFSVKDFITIGGFHPKALPHYASDYEWTIRACRKFRYIVLCNENLKYYVDEETTGDNHYEKMTRKKAFSKRSVSNPFYKFTFIVLATPAKDLPAALICQCKKYVGKRKLIAEIMKR